MERNPRPHGNGLYWAMRRRQAGPVMLYRATCGQCEWTRRGRFEFMAEDAATHERDFAGHKTIVGPDEKKA